MSVGVSPSLQHTDDVDRIYGGKAFCRQPQYQLMRRRQCHPSSEKRFGCRILESFPSSKFPSSKWIRYLNKGSDVIIHLESSPWMKKSSGADYEDAPFSIRVLTIAISILLNGAYIECRLQNERNERNECRVAIVEMPL